MDRETAIALLRAATALDSGIGNLFVEMERIEDIDVRKKMKVAVSDVMGLIARDIIFPVERMFPDLQEK